MTRISRPVVRLKSRLNSSMVGANGHHFIGAVCVMTRDMSANAIVVGNPGRVIMNAHDVVMLDLDSMCANLKEE